MALLELRGVAKHFGAIEALKGVDLAIEPGEVLGLMGDNGAGKSTLVKIIAGNFPPSEGEIRLDGVAQHFHKPVDARSQGIEIVYQDLALCDNLTAAENVFLGRELNRRIGPVQAASTTRPCTRGPPRSSRSSSPRPGRATWSSRCPAASVRRWRSRAPGCPTPRSC